MGILAGELEFSGFLDTLMAEPCPMPKMHQFVSTAHRHAAYVGGEGSGKTVSLVGSLIIRGMAEPGGLSLVGRLNMPALESTTMRTFLEMVPEDYGEWADTKKIYTFSNGHQVMFRHLDMSDPKVSGHVKSLNLSGAYVDEGSEISEQVFHLIIGRLRRKSTDHHVYRMSSNPAGHDWMWRYFFDPERKPYWKEKNLGITASSMENPFLPEEYIESRINLYPPDWADRFIYGHFSDFSDLVFKEFTEESHVWDSTKAHRCFGGRCDPPPEWPVIVGIDIGSDIDPWACVLVAVAPNGMLFQFEEVYGNSLLIRTIASELHLKLGSRPVDGMAYDYANRQAALELAEYDIFGSPAIKEVRPGLFKTAQYMHVDPRLEHPFSQKVKGSPRFFVSSACMNTRRELSSYKWAKDRSGNATGEPSHENSHSPDAVRYALHTFRPLPEKLAVPKLWENPALDAASRMYWMDYERFRDRFEHFQPDKKVPHTMQEWMGMVERRPVRFQRPHFARYSRLAN